LRSITELAGIVLIIPMVALMVAPIAKSVGLML
jgi:hypothetical protein